MAFVEVKIDLDGSARVVLHLSHQFDTDTQSLTSVDASSLGLSPSKEEPNSEEAFRTASSPPKPVTDDQQQRQPLELGPSPSSAPSIDQQAASNTDKEVDGMLLEGFLTKVFKFYDYSLNWNMHFIFVLIYVDSNLTVLSKGIQIPVYFVFNEEIASKVTMVEFMRRPSKAEHLYALVKVQTNLSDDQVLRLLY